MNFNVPIIKGLSVLQLQEYGREEPEIIRSSKKLASIDVILYIFDSADTNSFS